MVEEPRDGRLVDRKHLERALHAVERGALPHKLHAVADRGVRGGLQGFEGLGFHARTGAMHTRRLCVGRGVIPHPHSACCQAGCARVQHARTQTLHKGYCHLTLGGKHNDKL